MDDLLEAVLEPFAEAVVGAFFEGFNGVGQNGWTESKCQVQTLFDGVWWNIGESRNAPVPPFLTLCSIFAVIAGLKGAPKEPSEGRRSAAEDERPT